MSMATSIEQHGGWVEAYEVPSLSELGLDGCSSVEEARAYLETAGPADRLRVLQGIKKSALLGKGIIEAAPAAISHLEKSNERKEEEIAGLKSRMTSLNARLSEARQTTKLLEEEQRSLSERIRRKQERIAALIKEIEGPLTNDLAHLQSAVIRQESHLSIIEQQGEKVALESDVIG